MEKNSGLINNLSGLSVDISLSENLKEFPDIAETMKICYVTIANLLEIFDDRKHISEELFNQTDLRIQEEMNALDDCLVDICRDDIEIDRYNRMKKYYHEVRSDCMDHLLTLMDSSYSDINKHLWIMFDQVFAIILSLELQPDSQFYRNQFYRQMEAIKSILESDKYKEYMTILQYHSWGNKYKAAFANVKKLGLGKK